MGPPVFRLPHKWSRRRLAAAVAAVSVIAGLAVAVWYGSSSGDSHPRPREEPGPAELGPPGTGPQGPVDADPRLSSTTVLVFERRWAQCNHEHIREVAAGDRLAGASSNDLLEAFPGWQITSFEPGRVVLTQVLPGECPGPETPFTIMIRGGRVVVLRGTGDDQPVYLDTGIKADDLLPGDRAMLERGITVVGEERVWAYLEGIQDDSGH